MLNGMKQGFLTALVTSAVAALTIVTSTASAQAVDQGQKPSVVEIHGEKALKLVQTAWSNADTKGPVTYSGTLSLRKYVSERTNPLYYFWGHLWVNKVSTYLDANQTEALFNIIEPAGIQGRWVVSGSTYAMLEVKVTCNVQNEQADCSLTDLIQ